MNPSLAVAVLGGRSLHLRCLKEPPGAQCWQPAACPAPQCWRMSWSRGDRAGVGALPSLCCFRAVPGAQHPRPSEVRSPRDHGSARALPGSAEISGCGRDSWAPAGAVWQLIFLVFLPGALCCPSNCSAASAPPPRVGWAAGASPLPCVGIVRYFWGSLGTLLLAPELPVCAAFSCVYSSSAHIRALR